MEIQLILVIVVFVIVGLFGQKFFDRLDGH